MRATRGVPARTFDGSIAAIEAPAKYSCPPTTDAQGSVRRDARDYIAEEDAITGERCFDQPRADLASRYCEVLSAEAAPAYQREAPRTLEEAMSRPDAPRWLEAQHEELSSLTAKQVYERMMLPKGLTTSSGTLQDTLLPSCIPGSLCFTCSSLHTRTSGHACLARQEWYAVASSQDASPHTSQACLESMFQRDAMAAILY